MEKWKHTVSWLFKAHIHDIESLMTQKLTFNNTLCFIKLTGFQSDLRTVPVWINSQLRLEKTSVWFKPPVVKNKTYTFTCKISHSHKIECLTDQVSYASLKKKKKKKRRCLGGSVFHSGWSCEGIDKVDEWTVQCQSPSRNQEKYQTL